MNRYERGPDVPKDTTLVDTHGTRVDQDYIQQAVDDVGQTVTGRPSLSGHRCGGPSPQVAFRLPTEARDRAQRIAEAEGLSLSELARQALEEHIKRAS